MDVFKAEGELRLRSRESVSSREHLPREDYLTGMYTVGKVMLDLGDAPPPQLDVSDLPTVGLRTLATAPRPLAAWDTTMRSPTAGWLNMRSTVGRVCAADA